MQIIKIKKKEIDRKINLTIKKNEQLLIYGMNGSGKTMIINEIIKKKKNVIYEKKKENKTIMDIWKNEMDIKRTKIMIKYAYQLGLENNIKKNIKTWSTGQKKKLSFIYLIIKKKHIWLLDEPENFIDKYTIEFVKKKVIEHLNSNGMIIITKNKWTKNEQIKKIGLSGFEPLTFQWKRNKTIKWININMCIKKTFILYR